MQLLKEKIKLEGKIFPGNILKVDNFLNHQIDVEFLQEIGKEFKNRFNNCDVNKILTIEASGIGIACITAQFFNCPIVFAKKTKTKNISDDVYKTDVYSFTHKTTYEVVVSKEFIGENDNILVLDDFLAKGKAMEGLIDLINKSGANLAGCGVVIEKGFQKGGKNLRDKGIRLESLAIVDNMDAKTNTITFRNNTI